MGTSAVGWTGSHVSGRILKLDGWMASQPPRVGNGQGSLACCSPWGHKELDVSE